MATSAQPPINNGTPQGLPAVKPPSGRFILQLFLIPGLIVAGLVLVFVFGGLSWVGSSSPATFLTNLDNPNPDIRWRAAHELAQVLRRPESVELASDPDFAMEIALRLRKANEELDGLELKAKPDLENKKQAIAAQTNLTAEEKERAKAEADLAAWDKIGPQRDLVLYLIGCLGNFNVPVGVPVLSDIARMNNGGIVPSMSLRKRVAVLALANLGSNMNVFYDGKNPPPEVKVLTAPQKQAILDKLSRAAASGDERAAMSRYAYAVLTKEYRGGGVDKVLAECANHEDVFLRVEVAVALNFWEGGLVEPTLLKLSRDTGKGVRIIVPDGN